MTEQHRRSGRDLDRDLEIWQPADHLRGMTGGAFASGAAGTNAGKSIAQRLNPAHEDDYWRHEFPRRPYVVASPHGWDDFEPAYRLGYERYAQFDGRSFDEAELELSRHWDDVRGTSRLRWDEARAAARDAYERMATARQRA